MTEEAKSVPVARKPRTKKATVTPTAPVESPTSSTPKGKAADTAILDIADLNKVTMSEFKGSFRTKTGAVVTYL